MIHPWTAILMFFTAGFCGFYIIFILPIRKYRFKKNLPFIKQADDYMLCHHLKPETTAKRGTKEYNKAWAKLNADIRRKIKSGEIPSKEARRCTEEMNLRLYGTKEGKGDH